MALTADQITAKNFKEFYDKIFPYLNGGLARNNYSTDEKIVGTWIDGKPLYQKTIDCGAGPNATSKEVSSGLTGVTIVNMFGVATGTTVTTLIPHVDVISVQNGMLLAYLYDTNKIRIQSGGNKSSVNCCVTLQYTKNTD